MKTKADFQQQIANAISAYPVAAQLFRVGDPRLLAGLDAMAAQLALISSEMEVAAGEPFTKARDVTVLADAAVKGILPFGKSAQVRIRVENNSGSTLNILNGRKILDVRGREYVVDVGATIATGNNALITATQRAETSFVHTVGATRPFYTIEIPTPEPGKYVTSVRLLDEDEVDFEYRSDFINVEAGEKIFHILSDEFRKLQIELGMTDLVAYQPDSGEELTVIINVCDGAYDLSANAPFAFENAVSIYENQVTMKLDSIVTPGAAPMDIATMREVTTYPSVYDRSAVYLGNFDYLVRINLSPFRFLSVWNEQDEEAIRGPSLDNINTLFIAAEKTGVAENVLQGQITNLIKLADNSYKLRFVTINEVELPVTVKAYISSVYDFAAIKQQIEDLILAEYGEDSPFAKRGRNRVNHQRVYKLLRDNIPALRDALADLTVDISDPSASILPEDFRHVSEASLTVTVEQFAS